MTTRGAMKTSLARALGDEGGQTFTDAVLTDLVEVGLSEVGRVAPRRFQEDLTPVADTLVYQLLVSDFATPQPEIEVHTVEVWNGDTTPATKLATLPPRSGGDSAGGWSVWNGKLYLPNGVESVLDPTVHVIRVWGYAPPVRPTADGDELGLSFEQEMALKAAARVEALNMLLASRELYTQWQTRSGNSDISPAGLMNALSLAQEDWKRRKRELAVLRQAPG